MTTKLLGVLLVAVLGQEHIGRGLGGPVLPESLHLSRVGDGQFLQQGKSPVLGKVAVEGDGVGDTQARHDHEAHDHSSSLVVEILCDKHREEGASVDEDALHRTFSCLSA